MDCQLLCLPELSPLKVDNKKKFVSSFNKFDLNFVGFFQVSIRSDQIRSDQIRSDQLRSDESQCQFLFKVFGFPSLIPLSLDQICCLKIYLLTVSSVASGCKTLISVVSDFASLLLI